MKAISPRAAAVLALALASTAPKVVLAADGAGPTFKMMGPSTCAAWPKSGDITRATKAAPLNWALGFLSGWAAVTNVKLLDLIEPETVSAWLDAYCPAHTDVSLPLAVRELERQLEAQLPPPPAPPLVEAAPPAMPAIAPPAKAPRPTKARPVRRKPAR